MPDARLENVSDLRTAVEMNVGENQPRVSATMLLHSEGKARRHNVHRGEHSVKFEGHDRWIQSVQIESSSRQAQDESSDHAG